jgi:hypothetical protein
MYDFFALEMYEFDYEIETLETVFWPIMYELDFFKYLKKYQRKIQKKAIFCAHQGRDCRCKSGNIIYYGALD